MTGPLIAALLWVLTAGPEPDPTQDKGPTAQAPGAPLRGDPNTVIHVVEKKQFADRGKQEIALYPVAAQVNGRFTEHLGTALSYTYHLHEAFGLQLVSLYNWHATDSSFSRELIDKVSQEPQAATSLLLQWAIQAGVEVAPLYGKFAVAEKLVHFSLIVTGGAGVASTRHQLKPGNVGGPATFGDTGLRLAGSVGGGFRVQLGDRFAIRLELRDLLYSARVTRVNGCSSEDLSAMAAKVDQGQSVGSAAVSSGCDLRRFEGIDGRTNYNRSNDIPLALNLVSNPSSDVLNNVGIYAGLSFSF
jgi:outer membrane beta-barrel protein